MSDENTKTKIKNAEGKKVYSAGFTEKKNHQPFKGQSIFHQSILPMNKEFCKKYEKCITFSVDF